MDVELHNFCSLTPAGVSDCQCGLVSNDVYVCIGECGVCQSIAEWIQGVIADIKIVTAKFLVFLLTLSDRTPCVEMIVVERNLPLMPWHSHHKTSRWALVAKEDIGNGIAELRPSEPYIHDGGDMGCLPCHDRGASGEIEEYNGLARRYEVLQQ